MSQKNPKSNIKPVTGNKAQTVNQKPTAKAKPPAKASIQQKEKDLTLRAIVLADSYDIHFHPITGSLPRCLFPILNRPILCINLHQLKVCGFQDVIVYCTGHYDMIRDTLQAEGFLDPECADETKKQLPFQVRLISSDTAASVGDALRDLADQNVIQNDFLLLFGDLLTNVPFNEHVNLYRQLVEKDKRALLSIIYQNPLICDAHTADVGSHLVKWKSNDLQLILSASHMTDLETASSCREILHMTYNFKGLEIPPSILTNSQSPGLRLVRNAYDPGVVVCDAYVATQFQDNYDYNSIADLIEGVLHNPEVLDKSVYAVGLQSASLDFCYRIEHLGLYKTLSRLIMTRRMCHLQPLSGLFQLTPIEINQRFGRHLRLPAAYAYRPGHNHSSVRPSSHVSYKGSVVLGNDCDLSSCTLHDVVLGNNCCIADGAVLHNVICWDKVTIGKSCKIQNSLICANVHLPDNCVVNEHCVIVSGTYPPGMEFPPETVWLGRDQQYTEECIQLDERSRRLDFRSLLVYLQPPEDGFVKKLREEHNVEENFKPGVIHLGGACLEEASETENEDDNEEEDENLEEQRLFVRELQETWSRIKRETLHWKTILIEVNALKHAYAIEIDTLYMLLGRGVVDHAYRLSMDGANEFNDASFIAKLKELFSYVTPIIQHYITDHNSQNQHLFLQGIEEYLTEQEDIRNSGKAVNSLFHACYQTDIVPQKVILEWKVASPLLLDEELCERLTVLRDKMIPFFNWLEAESEESDSESE